MKERPILLSLPEARATLAGGKTQVRRLVHPSLQWVPHLHTAKQPTGVRSFYVSSPDGTGLPLQLVRPPAFPGERLWGRETWQEFAYGYDPIPLERFGGEFAPYVGVCNGVPLRWRACYAADGPLEHPTEGPARWRSPTNMPRWASRITLNVTSVRIERLQSISEADARAEGVEVPAGAEACPCQGEEEDPGPHLDVCPWRDPGFDPTGSPHRDEFAILWNKLNGKRLAWASNPWVWVVGFKLGEVRTGAREA